jgi:predicted metal-dependent hydrolase
MHFLLRQYRKQASLHMQGDKMKKEELSYSIIYTNRKTVSISISLDGSVLVRAPQFIKEKDIQHIIQQKIDWIIKKQNQLIEKTRLEKIKYQRNYDDTSTMPFQGIEYPIYYKTHNGLKNPIISLEQGYFQIRIGETYDKQKIRSAFRSWYFNKAKVIYMDRVSYYQVIMKESFGYVRIKEQKSCYGSCSSKRNLNFNWKCILAPKEVLDYIVVHELCHLKEMNHSKRFWAEVEKVYPNFKECKQWLKENNAFFEI